MDKTKVSSRGQTVIPLNIRKRYGIREGSRIVWIPRDNLTIVVRRLSTKKTTNWNEWARRWEGLGKELWKDIDPVKYTKELRRERTRI